MLSLLTGSEECFPPTVQRSGGGAEEELTAGVGKRGAARENAGTGSGQAGVTDGGGESQRGATLNILH